MTSSVRARYFLLLLACLLPLLPSCQTGGGFSTATADYVGRRYYVRGARFWGYLKRPGQPWDRAHLVIMKETRVRQPDRVPEGAGPLAHGFDHNREYAIRGRFTGETVYDPNADLELPSFEPESFRMTNPHPGYLFSPKDGYNPRFLPKREIRNTTPYRM